MNILGKVFFTVLLIACTLLAIASILREQYVLAIIFSLPWLYIPVLLYNSKAFRPYIMTIEKVSGQRAVRHNYKIRSRDEERLHKRLAREYGWRILSLVILFVVTTSNIQAQSINDISTDMLRHEGTFTYHNVDMGSTFLRLPSGQWYELRSAKWEIARTGAMTTFEMAEFYVEDGVYFISLLMEGSDLDIDRGHIFALFATNKEETALINQLESRYRLNTILSNGSRE